MNTIYLKGGKIHLTNQKEVAFRVETGQVLVYILPYKEGKAGRRFLLYEAGEGEVIPGLVWEHEQLGAWRFGLVALEDATLSSYIPENIDEVKMEFAKSLQLRLFSIEEFEEEVVEQYNINIIKEEGYIYATSLEQQSTYEKSLQIILDMFKKKYNKQKPLMSGNRLYDTVAYICNHMGIHIIPFEEVRESCKRKFDLRDIARLSHFTCREIVLEENWYKRDYGPIIGYMEKGREPVACIPYSPNSYIVYNPVTGESHKIDEKFAKSMEPKADMIYRPYPNKEIKWKDLLLFGFKSAYKRDFVNIAIMTLIGTIVGLLLPIMNEQLYDNFIPMADGNALVQICMMILACAVGNLSFTVVKNLAIFRSMNTMEYIVQSATYDRLFNLPESFFRKYESADLAQRAMGITTIFKVMADVLVKTLITGIFSILYLWRMFHYSKEMAKISLLMVVFAMIVIALIGYCQTKYEENKMELDGRLSSIMYQFLSGIAKIRIAGVENRALYEYLKPYSESRKIYMRKERMSIAVGSLINAIQVFFSMVLYYIMIWKNVDLSIGEFTAFMTAFGAFSCAMLEVVSSILDINVIIPAYKRCQPILSELPEFEENTVLPGSLTGDIEISNVTFAYDKETGPVLHDVSFHIKPGEYVGLVGASGCGKSTLMKLLLGFEQPQKGKIFYDGKDIDSMDKRELRKKFGVVLQDGKLISGSIYDNITITAPYITMKRVHQVIQEVGLEQDIENMPMGLHTVLSENSGTLSGGQQQRILIARAIVGKPKILFFDEATSALDNATQRMVCESLSKLKATRIVIAHRLSTVMDCDRIIVMDAGKIAEQGTYEELMKQKGLFYQLASRQII